MSSKSPIFPMPEPQHFSDYGFDPQIDYFQVLEEARKHKRETSSSCQRSIDSVHFKLQKPISKEDRSNGSSKKKRKKKRWWKNALLFFKWKWVPSRPHQEDVHVARARAFRGSISGPVYTTESRSGSSTPYRNRSTSRSGPLTNSKGGDLDIPYLSLRDLTMEQQHQRISTSATMPIYLVT